MRPGTFVAAVGADSEDKQEIAPTLMAGAMAETDVHADLADAIAGKRPGRESEDEITLFDSTGTALQDVAAAVAVYERALAEGAGIAVRFGD